MDTFDAITGQGVQPDSSQPVETQAIDPPNHNEQTSMESLLEEEGLGIDFPKQGEIRTGVIATLGENEILVSVGTKSEGIIAGKELESIPSEERDAFHVGLEIPVYVVTPEDQNGNVVLSYLRAREQRDWEEADTLKASGDAFDSKIIGYNKGGLLVPLGRLRGFVPASQISMVRRASLTGDTPEQRWGKMVGEEISTTVIEVDRERRRLILSERQALQETRETLKDRLLDGLDEGDVRVGRVTSVADFGAFVNIDGADGLVHLSEISWDRIQHPSQVLRVGQEVNVRVISIDRERKRIGLSIRQLEKDPWLQKVESLREGQLVQGVITHLTKFGAFARLDENLEGLIHVSEISEQRINHPKEAVKEGETVTLRIIKIDPERRRIGLSMRKVDSPAYADLDWKMALAEEVGDAKDGEKKEVSAPMEEAGEVEESPVKEELQAPDEVVDTTENPEEEEPQAPDEVVDTTEGPEEEEPVPSDEDKEPPLDTVPEVSTEA
ncbi:MAG: S1 RNA-binding domain-containing protein [Anaerolineales bacterium]|nr:S1 RNA-binding domain-containing protein [Anaerolineales bacterium]